MSFRRLVDQKEIEIFKKRLESGEKLSIEQLQGLKSVLKQVYIEHQVWIHQSAVQHLVEKSHSLSNHIDDIVSMLWEIDDMKEDYE